MKRRIVLTFSKLLANVLYQATQCDVAHIHRLEEGLLLLRLEEC